MNREEALASIKLTGLARILETHPFLPESILATYATTGSPGGIIDPIHYRVLLLTTQWLHLLEITRNPSGSKVRGEPVIRTSISTNQIASLETAWEAYDTFEGVSNALEVSKVRVKLELTNPLGPLSEIVLPVDTSLDYDQDPEESFRMAERFAEETLKLSISSATPAQT